MVSKMTLEFQPQPHSGRERPLEGPRCPEVYVWNAKGEVFKLPHSGDALRVGDIEEVSAHSELHRLRDRDGII